MGQQRNLNVTKASKLKRGQEIAEESDRSLWDPNKMKVFVGGIPFSTYEETVRADFEECGAIHDIVFLRNDNGTHKGVCFITFKTKEGVKNALSYDGDDYGGRNLKVAMATPRDK